MVMQLCQNPPSISSNESDSGAYRDSFPKETQEEKSGHGGLHQTKHHYPMSGSVTHIVSSFSYEGAGAIWKMERSKLCFFCGRVYREWEKFSQPNGLLNWKKCGKSVDDNDNRVFAYICLGLSNVKCIFYLPISNIATREIVKQCNMDTWHIKESVRLQLSYCIIFCQNMAT